MDRNQDLCSSLIKWLQTFNLQAPHRTVEEISDGVAMAQALTQIAPEWFDKAFISKIKPDVGLNWRLKVSNLKKIVDFIFEYYQDCLNQQLGNFRKPDVSKIAEYCDRGELGRLLQLILGCAVNCVQKQAYITVIMGMEESVQRVIMQAIQELESGSQLSLGPTEDINSHRLTLELERIAEVRDQMAQRCHELDMQVSLLQDEKASLMQEVSKLQSRLQEAENPASADMSTSKYSVLRREYDALREEIFKLESSRDDNRLRLESQDREIAELQARCEDMQAAADEARQLKDEMDVLRETADKVSKYEATIESYKRKLEELSDLKRQHKLLEEKKESYMQTNLELEEELKKQVALKSQADVYKKQIAELHVKLSEETKRGDKLAFENNKASDKLAAVTREKERLIAERDLLKEANEELTCQVSARSPVDGSGATAGSDELQPDLRERVARLAQENRLLKLQQTEVEQLAGVQAMLDAANVQIEALTNDSRSANQRILELESQIEELQVRTNEGGEEETSTLRKELSAIRSQTRSLTADLERLRAKSEQQEEQIEEAQRRNAQLKETLARKETELTAADEKYKKCLDKAKSVITNLEPKQVTEVATLRSQLLEKNSVIQRLEQDRGRPSLEKEQKLIASAFHQLGYQKQRESVDQRLATLSAGQSFLARQRVPVGRKIVNK